MSSTVPVRVFLHARFIFSGGIIYCSVTCCVILQRTQSMLCHVKNSGFVWLHGRRPDSAAIERYTTFLIALGWTNKELR